jgi:hypothetical protein
MPDKQSTNGRGRPRVELDPSQIEALAEIMCTNEEIAAVLGCSVDTITRNYAEAIKNGKAKGRASLRRTQWRAAESGNPTMLIWLGKQLLGQRDQPKEEEVNSLETILLELARKHGFTDED